MNKTVLICDDDEGIVDVIKMVLEDKGYTVQISTHCDEIFKKVYYMKPQLILLDLWMPGVGGAHITRELKKTEKTKHIPIIIISASKDTEQTARNAGADDFLTKPFDIKNLEEKVAQYIM
jgi:DNA-binding response OmpR family regulator